MESTKTCRGRRGAERMQPAGTRKGNKTSLTKEMSSGDCNNSTGSDSLSYSFKMGKEEKGGKMSPEEVNGWH